MRFRLAICVTALAALSAPAVAADVIGYVSVTDGNVGNFQELSDQFPGTVVAINGGFAYKGSYPNTVSCFIGSSDPGTACAFGDLSTPIEGFGPLNLDFFFTTGDSLGQSGTEAADFWTRLSLTNGDNIITTFRRVEPGTWTSPLADAGGGVPEPATWSMMILGFGLIGAGMRRDLKVGLSYSRA